MGDPCTDKSECLSGICSNGVCQGLNMNDRCIAGGCKAGLYCNLNAPNGAACAPTSPGYGGCSALSQCGPGNICNLAITPAVCVPLWSQPTGKKVNTPDLCASGMVDSNNLCAPLQDPSVIGTACSCGVDPTQYPGTICACASDGFCRVKENTARTANMIAARQAEVGFVHESCCL